jgi:hypothetical protein
MGQICTKKINVIVYDKAILDDIISEYSEEIDFNKKYWFKTKENFEKEVCKCVIDIINGKRYTEKIYNEELIQSTACTIVKKKYNIDPYVPPPKINIKIEFKYWNVK